MTARANVWDNATMGALLLVKTERTARENTARGNEAKADVFDYMSALQSEATALHPRVSSQWSSKADAY